VALAAAHTLRSRGLLEGRARLTAGRHCSPTSPLAARPTSLRAAAQSSTGCSRASWGLPVPASIRPRATWTAGPAVGARGRWALFPLRAAPKLPAVGELQATHLRWPPPCGPIKPWLPVTANPERPFVHFNTASPHSSQCSLLWCFVWSRYLVVRVIPWCFVWSLCLGWRINLRAESVGGRVVVICWWIWFYRGANFVGHLSILTLQSLNAL
jgi:hypothetical protein